MRIFLIFLVTLLLFGCRAPEKKYSIPSKKDINEIVKAVISQQTIADRFDSTGKVITGKPGIARFNPLDDLHLNINLSRPWSTGDTGLNHINIESLFTPQRNAGFLKKDSLYVVFQCRIQKGLKIDTAELTNHMFTSDAEMKAIRNRSRKEYFAYYYYQISVPLFSSDQKQAYLMLDSYYMRSQAVGYAFILKKINGKWKIVKQDITWIT